MDIKIDEETLLEELTMRSSVIGRDELKADGSSRYDEVHIIERDHAYLEGPITTAFSILIRTLFDFIENVDGWTITVDLSGRNNNAAISTLPDVCKQYMLDYVTSKWLALKAVDKAEMYAASAAEKLALIEKIIYFKSKPIV